jgi:cytochrome c
MLSTRMSRPLKLTLGCVALGLALAGCGHEKIGVPLTPATADVHHGAVLFSERCAGCHTFSYAATHGSAANVRTAQYNNGPNFDIRCERPIARVLYAIENGGFSGAIMPQNVVVGQDAIDVAKFVATYAGSKAPRVPGVTPCNQKAVGTISQELASAGKP